MSRYANTRPQPVVSLTDIMNEQLASKDVCDRLLEDQQDEELLLALYLSSIEAQNLPLSQINIINNNSNTNNNSENNNTVTNSSGATTEKSSSSQVDDDYLIAQLLQAELEDEQRKLQEQQDEDEDEEEYQDEEEEHGPRFMRTHKSSTGEIITKHHPARSGAKNAARLEATLTRLPTGDLSNSSTGSKSLSLPTSVFNSLHAKTKKITSLRVRNKNAREDRAVQEDVLDHRTRRDLQKLVNSGVLSAVHGAISTGKEARVFLAFGESTAESDSTSLPYAVKLFKHAVHGYADRERYLFTKSTTASRNPNLNPTSGQKSGGHRRLVTLWAEKEYRNLRSLFDAGVRVPQPIFLRKQLVLMKFLGDAQKGFPAPRLKEAVDSLESSQIEVAYWELVRQMRRMYQNADLVHADLSEYNVLWHDEQPWIIDVAQAVSKTHENALYFLRRDCINVADFFAKLGNVVGALSPRQMFEFITDVSIGPNEYEAEDTSPTHNFYLRKKADENSVKVWTAEEKAQDEVFLKCFIPKNLFEVSDPLQEIMTLREHFGDDSPVDVFHSSVTGLNTDLRLRGEKDNDDEDEDEEEEEEDSSSTLVV